MPHEFHASIVATLADDPKEMASAISDLTGAWADFLEQIRDRKVEAKFSINETRAKPGPKPDGQPRTRAPRGSRQQAASTGNDIPADPQSSATTEERLV